MFNDFIQYSGVNAKPDGHLQQFSQFNVSYNFYIPKDKKDIQQVTKVNISAKIIDSEIVKTIKGKSLEGEILTGNKLLCTIDIIAKIEYVPEDEIDSLQYAQITIPVFKDVVIDEEYNDCLNAYPSLIIEDIYCKQLEKRKLYLNVTLISVVDIF